MKVILLSSLLLLISCKGERPTDLGVRENDQGEKVLKPCPESPNCQSSFNKEDKEHFIDPIKYEVPKEEAKKRLQGILEKTKEANIIKQEEDYIYAEFTTSLMGFVDDVEFYFGEPGKIHLRSASRIGHSDMGKNKERLNNLKFRFYQNDL